jgi:Domain of unknown function (DUF4292)
MKKLSVSICLFIFATSIWSCKISKTINKAIAPKDSVIINQNSNDSLKIISTAKQKLTKNYIDFKTFNAKIKIDYEDSKGKKPDLVAIVRIIKDSAIWISLNATIFSAEVFRILITKDSVILLNKIEKEVQYRSLDYLQDITEIPFDYGTLQDLLVGNPVFLDSNFISYKKTDKEILLLSIGKVFKHLVTMNLTDSLLMHSKLDDVNIARNRTADITYANYENNNGIYFSTYREVTVSEKNKLDIRMNYKQFDFNKELSVNFNVPKNYKRL